MNESFGSNNNHSLHTAGTRVYFHLSFLLQKDNAGFNALTSISHVIGVFLSVLLCKCFVINTFLCFVAKCFKKTYKMVI